MIRNAENDPPHLIIMFVLSRLNWSKYCIFTNEKKNNWLIIYMKEDNAYCTNCASDHFVGDVCVWNRCCTREYITQTCLYNIYSNF